jgi:hypothetical protein
MFVRLRTGNRAGEVHEMKFADAKPLLDDGRAEQVYAEPPAPAIVAGNGAKLGPKPRLNKEKK